MNNNHLEPWFDRDEFQELNNARFAFEEARFNLVSLLYVAPEYINQSVV